VVGGNLVPAILVGRQRVSWKLKNPCKPWGRGSLKVTTQSNAQHPHKELAA
jgi:hypothetical protein